MEYSITTLATVQDCQSVINFANAELQALYYKKQGLDIRRSSSTLTAAEIEAELASVNAELPALQTMVDSLPEGAAKNEAIRRLKKAEYKKFRLDDRKGNYGVTGLIEKEYEISCIETDIEETVAFITTVTNRMNALR